MKNICDTTLESELERLYKEEQGFKYPEKKNSFLLVSLGNYATLSGNMGLQMIMHAVNTRSEGMHAHRAFLHPHGQKSLETREDAANYDIVGFSIPNTLEIAKLFEALSSANIPLLTEERNDNHPIIVGGGMGITNHEPFAPFIDVFVLGEGQVAAVELAKAYSSSANRKDFLRNAAQIEGILVPDFFKPKYKKGKFAGYELKPGTSQKPKVQAFFDYTPFLTASARVANQKGSILIDKSCRFKCRYCQYSHISGKYRQIPLTQIISDLDRLKDWNVKYVNVISASVTNHTALDSIIDEIKQRDMIPLLGSTIIDKALANPNLIDIIQKGYNEQTLPIDASSYQLRKQIGKAKVTNEKILDLAKLAIEKGVYNFRIYNVINLPNEREKDIDEFMNLLENIHSLDNRVVINLFCSPLFPEPKTPYERVRMETAETTLKKVKKIYHKSRIFARPAQHVPKMYTLEEEILVYGEDSSIRISTFTPFDITMQNLMLRGDRRTGLKLYELFIKGNLNYESVREIPARLELPNNSIMPWDYIEI